MSHRLHVIVYRLLLRVLPRRFRHQFGDEMVNAFREDLRHARRFRPGSWSTVIHWTGAMMDLIATVCSEWLPSHRRKTVYGSMKRKGFSQMDISSLFRDIRVGIRSLRRSPGFTALAILIVSLGVAANATIFSLTRSLLWEDPPLVVESSSLVRITRANANTQSGALSYPDYRHYREANEVFRGLMAYEEDGSAVSLSNGDRIETVRLGHVSDNYFDVLGVPMMLGREFHPEEDQTPGVGAVAILSHGIWTRSFGADSNVLGRSVSLNGKRFEIIGVAPREFVGLSPIETPPDAWVPLNMFAALRNQQTGMLQRVEGETWRWLSAVGRLRDGTSVQMAQSNMESLASWLAENFSSWNRPRDYSTALTMTRLLMAVAGLVLLVASANMALMLLARGSIRGQEIAIRRALGASRGRIARQLLTESSLIGVTGAVLGFVFTVWAMRPVMSLLPVSVSMNVGPDLPVFAFSIGAGLLTVLIFGTVPAMRATNIGVHHGTRATMKNSFGRNSLVVAQVAASLIVAAGAILFARSVSNARAVDLGFETENRLIASFNLRNHDYTQDQVPRFVADAIERVSTLPGVDRVSSTAMVPFQGSWGSSFTVPGMTPPDGGDYFDSGFNVVGPDYFSVFRVPLVAGRGFTGDDVVGNQPVLVVNQALARKIWDTEDVLGRSITWRDRTWTVVGVARDGTYYNIGEAPEPQVIAPVLQEPMFGVSLVVAKSGDYTSLARSIGNVIQTIDPNVAVARITTMDDLFLEEIGRYRTAAILVAVFGAVTVLLAAVGLYGVLSFLVTQRTREIGVRMAVGASAKHVAREVIARGIRFAAVGIGIGLVGAVVAAQFATTFLFGVRPGDPSTFVAAAAILGLVAAAASAVPAIRATRVDPIRALKTE